MKKSKKVILLIIVFLLTVIVGCIYGYYRHIYPYGSNHRCSKSLAMFVDVYADAHGGNYPQAIHDGQLGLDQMLEDYPASERDMVFEMIVGKAGDLGEAREFYDSNGYLLSQHSSWHYIQGLTKDDFGRALAWDKVPLTHNGMRKSYNPREVMIIHKEIGIMVTQVNEDKWPRFLEDQKALADKSGKN